MSCKVTFSNNGNKANPRVQKIKARKQYLRRETVTCALCGSAESSQATVCVQLRHGKKALQSGRDGLEPVCVQSEIKLKWFMYGKRTVCDHCIPLKPLCPSVTRLSTSYKREKDAEVRLGQGHSWRLL